jgi:hypothetical protein
VRILSKITATTIQTDDEQALKNLMSDIDNMSLETPDELKFKNSQPAQVEAGSYEKLLETWGGQLLSVEGMEEGEPVPAIQRPDSWVYIDEDGPEAVW